MEIDRRDALWLASSVWTASLFLSRHEPVEASRADRSLRFGLITDLHYADKPAAGTRHYRETLSKLKEAVEAFSRLDPPIDFVVELGGLIDAAESVETERKYLATVDELFRTLGPERY